MIVNKFHLDTCFLLFFCTSSMTVANATELEEQFPVPNPPFFESKSRELQGMTREKISPKAATIEWTFHKTPDGSHPNGHEQQIVWLMNRARANPTQEGIWLASSTEPDVAGGRTYFGVDLNKLQNEFAALAAKPPAAFDNRLYAAAFAHSANLISRDAQDHNQQFARVSEAGFNFWGARGSVFSYASSGLNAHAAWNIDWGPDIPDDGDGMQAGRGHRMATMATDGDYTNVGIAAIHETNPATNVGEFVTTGNYCQADTSSANHFNTFIVGTVWNDINGNNQYDPGEGKANVNVSPDRGVYYAVTGESGGYAIPVINNDTYNLTFSGPNLTRNYTKSATLNGKSVLVDIETGNAAPTVQQGSFLPAIMLLLD